MRHERTQSAASALLMLLRRLRRRLPSGMIAPGVERGGGGRRSTGRRSLDIPPEGQASSGCRAVWSRAAWSSGATGTRAAGDPAVPAAGARSRGTGPALPLRARRGPALDRLGRTTGALLRRGRAARLPAAEAEGRRQKAEETSCAADPLALPWIFGGQK